jgi:hypothetical protein
MNNQYDRDWPFIKDTDPTPIAIHDDWIPSEKCIGILCKINIKMKHQGKFISSFINYWKTADLELTQKKWDSKFYYHCIRNMEFEKQNTEQGKRIKQRDFGLLYEDH